MPPMPGAESSAPVLPSMHLSGKRAQRQWHFPTPPGLQLSFLCLHQGRVLAPPDDHACLAGTTLELGSASCWIARALWALGHAVPASAPGWCCPHAAGFTAGSAACSSSWAAEPPAAVVPLARPSQGKLWMPCKELLSWNMIGHLCVVPMGLHVWQIRMQAVHKVAS